jgi:hypothetical protein
MFWKTPLPAFILEAMQENGMYKKEKQGLELTVSHGQLAAHKSAILLKGQNEQHNKCKRT